MNRRQESFLGHEKNANLELNIYILVGSTKENLNKIATLVETKEHSLAFCLALMSNIGLQKRKK